MHQESEGDPIRIAQLGVAQPHAAGYRATLRLMPELTLVAAYDPEPEIAREQLAGEGFSGTVYSEIATLLEQEQPQAVIICLSPVQTPAAIELAANAGCHIHAEKPCARTASEFLPALQAMERAGVQFATGYLRRSSPIAREIREIIADGLLGQPVSAEISMKTASVRRRDATHWLFRREVTGGGILNWLGCHWIDLLWFTTGQEIASVSAMMKTLSGAAIDVEDTAAVTLGYEGGMVATIHCSYILDQGPDQLSIAIHGTKGWLRWDGVGPELRVYSSHPSWSTAPNRTFRFESDQVPGYGGTMGLDAMQRFVSSFRDGESALYRPSDALRVLHALDAAAESSRTGQLIELTPSPFHSR